jgi:amino acid transporter
MTDQPRPGTGSSAVGAGDRQPSADIPADWRGDGEDRRREAYGGVNYGAAFFGWLVAIALTVLLASIVGAIAAALGNTLNFTQSDAQRQAGTVAISTAVALLIVLVIAYFAGGYVAGRMSRYDGGRQGGAVWLIGLIITVVAVTVGGIAGSQYDIFRRVNLPSIPVPTDALTTGGIIALAAVLVGTLAAAFAGGKVGQRYHRKIDSFSL